MDEIKVGSEILEYITIIEAALTTIGDAQINLNRMANIPLNYKGLASDEITLYTEGLKGHVGKLSGLYYKIAQYMGECFNTYIDTDEKLAQLIENSYN